jgi:hypothetical protein
MSNKESRGIVGNINNKKANEAHIVAVDKLAGLSLVGSVGRASE